MLMIGSEESMSISGYVESPGYVRMALQGYVYEDRPDGRYVTRLLPQMFYGADGTQLTTWRQYIPSAGSQVILSKPAGHLLVPKGELYWRKISGPAPSPAPKVEAAAAVAVPTWILAPVAALAGLVLCLWGGKSS